MNTRLTEFQRVNGSEDDLLPLYITNETNKTNIIYWINTHCLVLESISIILS